MNAKFYKKPSQVKEHQTAGVDLLIEWSWKQGLSLKGVERQRLDLGEKRRFGSSHWPRSLSNTPMRLDSETCASLNTLSVCFLSVEAGFPWAMSHRTTVSSADALAKTFLGKEMEGKGKIGGATATGQISTGQVSTGQILTGPSGATDWSTSVFWISITFVMHCG